MLAQKFYKSSLDIPKILIRWRSGKFWRLCKYLWKIFDGIRGAFSIHKVFAASDMIYVMEFAFACTNLKFTWLGKQWNHMYIFGFGYDTCMLLWYASQCALTHICIIYALQMKFNHTKEVKPLQLEIMSIKYLKQQILIWKEVCIWCHSIGQDFCSMLTSRPTNKIQSMM